MSRATDSPDAAMLRQFLVYAEEPAHLLLALAIGGYAWRLHGLTGAILTICAIIVIIGLSNMAILRAGGGRRLTRFSRWAWLAIILAALVLVGRPEAEQECKYRRSGFWGLPQLAFCDPPAEGARQKVRPPNAANVPPPANSAQTRTPPRTGE